MIEIPLTEYIMLLQCKLTLLIMHDDIRVDELKTKIQEIEQILLNCP